ncbi:DUF2637 domain-containing protein [Catenulispora rubra]|uniref:DUF2637 domain-containing protein n=1 Tax=Catenulispora rubra TaxID=280293 RepID=UPI001891F56A|nr:DUF2637 domain-containing protein [Catenulispora rubra]
MRNQSTVRAAQITVLAGIAAVIAAAFGLSAAELNQLGHDAGWSGYWAMLFPVTIDVYALISTLVWLVLAETPEDRRQAAAGAFAAVGISIAGNTVEHLHQAGVIPISWPVVVAASAVPPVVMALAIHVAVRALAVPTAIESGKAEKIAWAGLDEPAKLARVRDVIDTLTATGQPVTGRTIAEHLGTTDRTGRTYLSKIALTLTSE